MLFQQILINQKEILLLFQMTKFTWNEVSTLSNNGPSRRWGHSICAVQNQMFIFGGYEDSKYYNDLWIFDTTTLQWSQKNIIGEIPKPRSQATLNYHKLRNQLILFGGGSFQKQRLNQLFKLNLNALEWQKIIFDQSQKIPDPRTYHTAQIIEQYLIVFGGQELFDKGDLWVLNLKTFKWIEILNSEQFKMPSARRFHTSCVKNNRLIIIGGCQQQYKCSDTIYQIDFTYFIETDDYTHLKSKEINIKDSENLLKRWGHSASYCPLNDKIYLFGGRFQNDLKSLVEVDVDQLKVHLIKTEQKQTLNPRRRHSSCFIGWNLIIFGGFNGFYLKDLHTINLNKKSKENKFKLQAIDFLSLLKKNDKVAKKYFQNLKLELLQKYQQNQKNQILTSIFLGYQILPTVHTEKLKFIMKQTNKKYQIFESKYQKIVDIKYRHGVDSKKAKQHSFPGQNNLQFQNFTPQHFENGIKNEDAETNKCVYNSMHGSKDDFSEILLLNSQVFYYYMKKNLKIEKIDKKNPEVTENILEKTSLKNKDKFIFDEIKNEKGIYIEINNSQLIKLDEKVLLLNEVMRLIENQSNKIVLKQVKPLQIYAIYIYILYLQSKILVVPENIKIDQWQKLLTVSDYFCDQSLKEIIEGYLISKTTFQNVFKLLKIAYDWNMKRLIDYAASLIIAEKFKEFYSQNLGLNEKSVPQKFNEFENLFWLYIQTDFVNQLQKFQQRLFIELESNRLKFLIQYFKEVLKESKIIGKEAKK